MTNDSMYAEIILDHYKHPRNFGALIGGNAAARDVNTLCGDAIEMNLRIKDGRIEDVCFSGSGCAISQAAASMLTEEVKGKSLDDVRKMDRASIVKMLGIDVSPARIKCALLSLKVLKIAIYNYLGEKMSEEENDKL
jgi:nitrogen fixation protein NifU and related proteins